MARLKKETFRPDPAAQRVYDQLYREYRSVHDYFGGGDNDGMKRLKHIKVEARHH